MPKVNKFKGSSKILSKGTSIILATIKAREPIIKPLAPPFMVSDGSTKETTHKAPKFIKKARKIVFTI